MIQDIFPKKFYNQYSHKEPNNNSIIINFVKDNVLLKNCDNSITYPKFNDFKNVDAVYTYLFKIDDTDFFLAKTEKEVAIDGFSYENRNSFRFAIPKENAFAGITAYHLYNWYQANKYCGKCGKELKHDAKERMLFCDNCKNSVYPKIAPAVIVGVTDGDKLLMTKYNGREYKNYALIAGFIEVGENAEEAVKREVMEEAGLNVKNVRYYKSQPWGLSDNLLFGFFAELDGDPKITLDENELSEGLWVSRDEIDYNDTGVSITGEMIAAFKNNTISNTCNV